MKRALTIMLTVAMVGSLMFMGFAGTAAAQDVEVGDIDFSGGDGGDGGDAVNVAEVNQQNSNSQVGVGIASATGAADHHYEKKHNGHDDGAVASTAIAQEQNVAQQNAADVDQTAVAGDGGDGGDGGAITFDFGDILDG